MKRTLAAIGVVALGLVGLAGFANPASATDAPDCKTGTVTITDRVDSGVSGNWAKDTFTRKYEVCHAVITAPKADVIVPGWSYSVKLWDNGTFVTTGTTSPMGHAMLDGMKGTFSGIGKDGLSVSGIFEAPANWQGWTAPTNTNQLDTTNWIKHLFTNGDDSTVSNLKFDWGWIYKLCNEYWVNSSDGNKGDITGKARLACPKPPVFTDKCDGSTAVTLANGAYGVKALYNVSGVETNHGNVWVDANSTVNVTVKPESGKTTVTYYTIDKMHREPVKVVVDHVWTEPKNCVSPSPSTSTSAPAPVPGESHSAPGGLPVTGPNTGYYAGAGAIALGLGIALVMVLRRRRVKFEA